VDDCRGGLGQVPGKFGRTVQTGAQAAPLTNQGEYVEACTGKIGMKEGEEKPWWRRALEENVSKKETNDELRRMGCCIAVWAREKRRVGTEV